MIVPNKFLKRSINQSLILALRGYAQTYQQQSLSKLPLIHFLRQRFHLLTQWLKSARQQAEMSQFLQKQLDMTPESVIDSCKQELVLVVDVYQKISVPLWRARRNLAQIKHLSSYAKSMQLTCEPVNESLMLFAPTFQKTSLNTRLQYWVRPLSPIAMMCATPQHLI